eukprot:gene21923-26324_t
MIKFDKVTKAYPDGTIAVDALDLECPTGKITALVGPSGCGKTTSLRMINRLIEPTSGTISLDGESTAGMDPALLRRRIGYVIQHAGLFPHRTIVDNIATMPRLLGATLKLGDQVVVLRTGGILAQAATPLELLTQPADEFVADFVGRDRGYRSLGFTTLDGDLPTVSEPVAHLGDSAAAARALTGDTWLLVVDPANKPLGWVRPDALTDCIRPDDLNLSGTLADSTGTMRALLDAALSAPSKRGVVVDDAGRLVGTVTAHAAVEAIEAADLADAGRALR